jgi:RND superfamily putative drug exporter
MLLIASGIWNALSTIRFSSSPTAAILVDATIVRMVLVPAVMQLLGRANWWIPRWPIELFPDCTATSRTRRSRPNGPEKHLPQVPGFSRGT